MPDPMEPEFTAQNPIVAAAERIRARREFGTLIDAATSEGLVQHADDAEASLRSFAQALTVGIKRLNAILGQRNGVRIVCIERPFRIRLRFGEWRIALELIDDEQLIRVRGLGLDGDYQFIPEQTVPAMMNLSQVSTSEDYGEALTASSLLKLIARDAELPRPPHLDAPGPLSF